MRKLTDSGVFVFNKREVIFKICRSKFPYMENSTKWPLNYFVEYIRVNLYIVFSVWFLLRRSGTVWYGYTLFVNAHPSVTPVRILRVTMWHYNIGQTFTQLTSREAIFPRLYVVPQDVYPFLLRKHVYIILTPLKPHFYIVKLGFTVVYIIFLTIAQKHRLWVLVRTASPSRNMKNTRDFFYMKIFSFLEVKFSIYLNRSVFFFNENITYRVCSKDEIPEFWILNENITYRILNEIITYRVCSKDEIPEFWTAQSRLTSFC